MSQLHTALILAWHEPHKYKAAILDSSLGRVDALFYTHYPAGTLFSYERTEARTLVIVKKPKILDMPLELAAEDLLFVHHVLEIVYQCVPVGSEVRHLYSFLECLYYADFFRRNMFVKKLFLFKLLVTIGFQPELPDTASLSVARLLAMSLDLSENETTDAACVQVLDDWLRRCIAQHPRAEKFKTLRFLMQK